MELIVGLGDVSSDPWCQMAFALLTWPVGLGTSGGTGVPTPMGVMATSALSFLLFLIF